MNTKKITTTKIKTTKIKINGQQFEVADKKLSYGQICALAFQPTVVYAKGLNTKPQGTLKRGQVVDVVEGMTITCVRTGAA